MWDNFSGVNDAYIQELFERFRADPASVDPVTRDFFDRWGPPPHSASPTPPVPAAATGTAARVDPARIAGAVALATAIRDYGYRAARLDPLGCDPAGDAALRAETHGIREEDLAALPASIIASRSSEGALGTAGNALEAIRALRGVYQGTSGYEFEHVSDAEERSWLRRSVETGLFRPPRDPVDELELLKRLTEVGALERFLHSAFPGQTRFSLEGLGMMIPMLDEIIGAAAESGTRQVLIGMAHRGRLNVLAHILGKPYEQMLAEFLGDYRHAQAIPTDSSDEGWTGDVKYHFGARKAYRGGQQLEMQVYLAPNPSHLEWVNPVVVGMDRACDERRDAPGPARQDELASMSLLIHGDASFPGQGIVAETLNLSRLPGYRIGGSIHLIANNQIGFTTAPSHGRSTLFASDLAKGFEIPVIHVNADDVEACIAASRLAHAYRERFRKDVVIDLIGYRRWGHNEGDEPTFTQPRLYRSIADHPTVREQWAAELVKRGLVPAEETGAMLQRAIERLHTIRRSVQEQQRSSAPEGPEAHVTSGLEAGGITGGLGHPGPAEDLETAVPEQELAELNRSLYQSPESFHLHPKLQRPFTRRRDLDWQDARSSIDWAHAEALALAAILTGGTPVRLTGQDCARGTFGHRHAVLYDSETGEPHTPLQALPQARASFEVWNSPLSEQATLGFEFGYTIFAPETLVIWEAQYGDFINVAQPIVDQFIASARSKWGQRSGLVMLLPHGYEGQGPEHSSARLERFLQIAAEDNIRVANCTTSAQYFHILRRQAKMLWDEPRPLILMTPKSLLRNPNAASRPELFSAGRFQPLLVDVPRAAKQVRRLVLCSGKVYYDMAAALEKSPGEAEITTARVEELYPFPSDEVSALVESLPLLEEVVWLQEEPRNMGAWTFAAPRLRDLLGDRLPLRYIGRTRRASPAEGSHEWHSREQARLIADACTCEMTPVEQATREVEHAG